MKNNKSIFLIILTVTLSFFLVACLPLDLENEVGIENQESLENRELDSNDEVRSDIQDIYQLANLLQGAKDSLASYDILNLEVIERIRDTDKREELEIVVDVRNNTFSGKYLRDFTLTHSKQEFKDGILTLEYDGNEIYRTIDTNQGKMKVIAEDMNVDSAFYYLNWNVSDILGLTTRYSYMPEYEIEVSTKQIRNRDLTLYSVTFIDTEANSLLSKIGILEDVYADIYINEGYPYIFGIDERGHLVYSKGPYIDNKEREVHIYY